MASAGEKELHAAISKRVFHPVYYLHGDDDYLKEGSIRDIVAAAVDPATRDFNYDVRRGNELSPEELDALLSTPPMLAERRVVVIRDVDKLKKDARRVLDSYLTNPARDTTLLLTSACGVKSDRTLAERGTAVEFAPLGADRVAKWIAYYAEKEMRRKITADAIALLMEGVGDDLQQLSVELEKLASYTDDVINAGAVSDIVGIRKEESLGAFLDAVAARDAANAIALLPGILQIPKMSAIPLVMNLTTQMLALGFASASLARGTPRQALYNELMGLLKSTGAFPGRAWGEAVTAWTKYADRWNAEEIDIALSALLKTDEALKETKVSSEEQLLGTLILNLCAPRALQRAG
jgi:DNA polymerase-3 subunit delta